MGTIKIKYLAILILFIVMSSCNEKDNEDIANGTPDCIKVVINHIKTEAKRNPPAKIYRYLWRRKTVYYFTSYCCDIPSDLFDSTCALICHPDGGFSGTGDGNCVNFITEKTNETLVWQDNR